MIPRVITPLTNNMLETLMDCHERELMNLEPCNVNTKHIKGLFQRGLIKVSTLSNDKGKRIDAIYLTDLAKRYLETITGG